MRVIHSLEVSDEAQVGAVRRAVHTFASGLDFTERELAEIDIVVQEIGTNAARYSRGGGYLHYTTPLGAEPGLEIFYWDKGPGIHDLERVLRDGVSTSGSLGTGFGAIRRLMDEFDIYSATLRALERRSSSLQTRRTTHGTALLCRKWVAAGRLSPANHAATARRIGAWSRPRAGEDANGDAYFVRRRGKQMLLAVVDGLGRGYGAQEVARLALEVLREWRGETLDDLFERTHAALRSTRGVVMGAILLDAARETFYYAGVGNIEVRVFNAPEPTRPISNNGTLGARLERLRIWEHKWTEGTVFVLTSDGLSASWDIEDYPALLHKSPQLLAGVLMRDYGRDSDDATVLVGK